MKPARVVRTVTHGALRIDVRRYSDGRGGATRFGFDWQGGTRTSRKKVRRLSIEDAVTEAEKLLGASRAGRLDALKIHPGQFAEFLRWQATQQSSITVADIADEFLASKATLAAKKELSRKHVSDLSGTIRELKEHFGAMTISEMAADRKAVEKWLFGRNTGPLRFNHQVAHIVSLIRYARAYRHLSHEPTPVEAIPRRKTTTKKETYSPTELASLLRTVPLEWLPAIALGAFCGIRPEEISPDYQSHKAPLRWENFLWHKEVIDMPADVAKDQRRRLVPMHETVIEWLAPWRNARGPTVPRTRSSGRPAIWAKAAGITWKFDALRHSYASYRLAMTQNIAALSLEMGNSVAMIRNHYLDVKRIDEGLEYFSLTPEKVGRAGWSKIAAVAV